MKFGKSDNIDVKPTMCVGWEEIQPGTWYRKLDCMERLLYFCEHIDPNLAQWTPTVGLKLPKTSQYSVKEIQAAWISLRLDYPTIACTIENGRGMQYQILTKDELVRWAEKTVHIHRFGKTAHEMAISATIPESSTLHFFPESQELAILIRHELCDGVGCLILANKLLQNLRIKPRIDTIGEEIARLPSPTIDLLNDKSSMAPEIIERADHIVGLYCDTNAIALQTRQQKDIQKAIPTLPQGRVEHQFSERESQAILDACRAKKITVTTAIWAAQAKAALEHSGDTAGNLISFLPINLRNEIISCSSNNVETKDPPANNTIIFALTNLPVAENDDFVDWAKMAQRDLHSWRFSKNNICLFELTCKALEENMATDVAAGIMHPARFFLTNVGISENYIREPVEDVWLNLMVSTPESSALIVLTTHRKLRFAACYNRAFFHDNQVKDYMAMVVSHLKNGLGLRVLVDKIEASTGSESYKTGARIPRAAICDL
ncbi:hypothetical protein EYR41_006433 [Orbilia oligospora]|uniref:Uncharacterized protein n=1 Tax=Orbilia oligospora TaxID=2813651 RepID=A0A7C8TRM1_ORBOL|nr:hypothetical protein TWF751_001999 [Orbilia oligospora]TGJ67295.1 hypothetical protein EYR41_006433 [Orbilia oligospora]